MAGASDPSSRPRRRGRPRPTGRRPSDDTDAAEFRARLANEHPSFRTAVVADAAITARYRGERHQFRSRFDALLVVARLALVTDSFFAQVCYRAKVSARRRRIPLAPSLLHHLSVTTGQISIGDHAVVRPGVYLPHGQVVIDGFTFVDTGAVLRPFVTLGLVDGQVFGPHIGPRARIGTGAKIIGPVRVGADSQIGANAVVNRNVAKGATVVGVPARPLT